MRAGFLEIDEWMEDMETKYKGRGTAELARWYTCLVSRHGGKCGAG